MSLIIYLRESCCCCAELSHLFLFPLRVVWLWGVLISEWAFVLSAPCWSLTTECLVKDTQKKHACTHTHTHTYLNARRWHSASCGTFSLLPRASLESCLWDDRCSQIRFLIKTGSFSLPRVQENPKFKHSLYTLKIHDILSVLYFYFTPKGSNYPTNIITKLRHFDMGFVKSLLAKPCCSGYFKPAYMLVWEHICKVCSLGVFSFWTYSL